MTDTGTELDRPEPSSRPHRLERPLAGRWAAGVAHALGDDWGTPVWVIRLAFVVLAPIGGLGFLLYAIGWLFIPREGAAEPLVSRWIEQLRDRQAWLGAALVTAAAIIVLSSLNIVDTGLIWAGALLVLGVLLYRGELGALKSHAPSSQPGTAVMDTEGSENHTLDDDIEVLHDDGDHGVPTPPPLIERPSRPPRPPREPSYLGRLTLGAMLVAIGVMVAFDVSGITHPTSRHYFAAPIIVIGIGLLVGAFFGRSRGLIVFGLLLAPVALFGALVDMPLDGKFGDIDVFADSPADLEPSYRLAGGDIYLDLRQLELSGETVSVDANVGVGHIFVALPVGYQVEIDGHVRLGELDILGRASDGLSLDRLTARPGSGGTILLSLDAGVGRVVVRDYAESQGVIIGADDRRSVFRPASIEDLQATYFLPSGSLELDLRGIPPLVADIGLEVMVEATVGRGELVVVLPPWLSANIAARSGTGVLDILGRQIAGVNLVDEIAVEGEGEGHLGLVLTVEQGSIVVVRP